MPRYMTEDDVFRVLSEYYKHKTYYQHVALAEAIQEVPTADVVERSAYDQVRWERDTAIAQLAEIGKGFGETMDDVVVRKRGKWEAYYDDDDPQDGIWKCSVCGYIRLVDDNSPTNFCPNCGADMRGGDTDA